MPVSKRSCIGLGKTRPWCDVNPRHHTSSMVPKACMDLLVVRIVTMAFVYKEVLLEVGMCLALLGLYDRYVSGLLGHSSFAGPAVWRCSCAFAKRYTKGP